jgi:hypothetical protein
MDSLFTWLLATFNFFASGMGILAIGGIAIAMILLWEWRLFLLGLCVIQLGVVVLLAKVHHVTLEWVQVQMLTSTLSAAILFLSARQIRFALPYQRPGSGFVHIMAVILLLICWPLFNVQLPLPLLAPPIARLFLWLSVCALIMLGLGDAPLSTGVALLLWLIPVQGFLEVLLPEFRLFVLIGMIQILSALACSYLMLAARQPVVTKRSTETDIAFPASPSRSLPSLGTGRPLQPQRLLPSGIRSSLPAPSRSEGEQSEQPLTPRNAS